MKSSGSTPKKSASSRLISPYSGYTARPASLRCSRRYSITFADAPTVFSLKSRRSLPARPPVGGEYGAILSTASRGCNTPGGRSILLLAKTHHIFQTNFDGTCMCFQTFGAREGRNRRRKVPKTGGGQLLHRNDLHKIGGGKTAPN